MRIALLSNVQANLPALTAVLRHIEARPGKVEAVISAGDIVGLGPYPNEVVELLRERQVESVRGNYDDAVGHPRLGSGMDFVSLREEQVDRAALAWTAGRLTPRNLEYIRELPRDIRVLPQGARVRVKRDAEDEQMANYRKNFLVRSLFGSLMTSRPVRDPFLRVRVVHGSPRALNEFLRQDTANSILGTIARDAETDVLISGHAGDPFQREAHGMTFVGLGAVSAPLQLGIARYAVLETGRDVSVDFVEVEYDAAEYRRALLESGLPSDLLRS